MNANAPFMDEVAFSFSSTTVQAAGRKGPLGQSLRTVTPGDADTWVWLAYDQLNAAFLKSLNLGNIGVVLVESSSKAKLRPYHQQKLGMLLSNQRHFALELQSQGIPVLYLLSTSTYGAVIAEVSQACGPVHCFRHAERELRKDVESLLHLGALVEHEHPGWLTPQSWFLASVGSEPPYRMDAFYRKVRQQTGWMMEDGKPVGGKYSYDAENRFPWKGEPAAPPAPVYEADAIDTEVEALVRSH